MTSPQRRAVRTGALILATVLAGVLLGFGMDSAEHPPAPELSAAPTVTTAAAPATPTPQPVIQPAPPQPTPPPPVGVSVTRVIDGDTFEIAGGQRVRVLGIDSCEMSTPGGPRAKADAVFHLTDPNYQPIKLVSQPGAPDKDRYGRLLRYVQLGNSWDLGETMVIYSHTGVYQGKSDASPEYMNKLRELDGYNGRDCAWSPEAENHYVPVPNGGDDDDHKSRYCRRHWYC